MLAGRRFRVELSDAQAQRTADAFRAVYNTGLEQRREYRRRGAWMSYQAQAAELVEAKTEHSWLKEVSGHCCSRCCATWMRRAANTAPSRCGGARLAGGRRRLGSPKAPRWPNSASETRAGHYDHVH